MYCSALYFSILYKSREINPPQSCVINLCLGGLWTASIRGFGWMTVEGKRYWDYRFNESISCLNVNIINTRQIDPSMQLGISDDIISFLLACGRPVDAALFAADIEDISPSHLHFLVLVILKLQPVHIFLRSFHLGSVECSGLGISSEHLLSDGKIGQRSIGPRDCYQRCGVCLVDLTRSTILIRFRVLDLVSDLFLA